MVFCQKKQKQCLPEELNELNVGDCWIGLSLAKDSGLILSVRIGKHTDAFLDELVVSAEVHRGTEWLESRLGNRHSL